MARAAEPIHCVGRREPLAAQALDRGRRRGVFVLSPEPLVSEARRSALWFALPHRAVIEVSGSDRVSWLNGMVSNVLPPDSGGCTHATILTPKGRVVADLEIVRAGETLWLELERTAAAATLAHLERYVISEDVKLENRSDELVRMGIEGPASAERLAVALPDWSPEEASPGAAWRVAFESESVVIAAFGFSGQAAFQIMASAGLAAPLQAALEGAGVGRGDDAELEALRIEAGIPRLGYELDDQVLPDEARLHDAISTTKGCYTGQEIVARLRSRAQVQHLLVGLRLEALPPEPAAGEAEPAIEVDGKRSGELTSVGVSKTFGPIALGFVRREHAEDGREVELVREDWRSRARIALLPFAPPTGSPEAPPATQ